MKKTLTVLILSLLLFGCSAKNEEKSLLDEIKERGELIVATSPDFPPYEYIDPSKTGDDKYVGSDIELAKYIAEKLGVKLKLEISDFSATLAALSTKKADIIISGLGYNQERLKAMDFTKTYNPSTGESYHGLMIRKEDESKFKSLADFNKAEVKVGAQSGSLQEGYTTSQLPDATIERVGDISTAILMLQSGKVDALAMSSSTGFEYQEANSDLLMTDIAFESDTLDEYNGTLIGVVKGESELLDELNKIVDEVVSEGLYQDWLDAAKKASGEE